MEVLCRACNKKKTSTVKQEDLRLVGMVHKIPERRQGYETVQDIWRFVSEQWALM